MDEISRRTLLRGAALGVATTALSGAGALSVLQVAVAAPPRLRRGQFLAHVGTGMRLSTATAQVRADLVEVADLPHAPAGDQHRFSLRFQLPGQAAPEEGIFSVGAPGLRPVDLFVSPVSGVPGRYEAVVAS